MLLLKRAGVEPEEFRDTMAAMFLGLNILGAIALVAAGGRAELPDAGFLGLLAAAVALGRPIGRLIFERLDPDSFRVAGLVLITLTGIASIAAGLAG